MAMQQRYVRAARAKPLGHCFSSETAFVSKVALNSWSTASPRRKEVLPGY